jgi:hydrogenase maturation protease
MSRVEVPMLRRFFSLVGVLLAIAGTAAFIFVGVKVWHVKAEVNRQARYLAAKAHSGGDAADRAITFVRQVLAEAKADLAHVAKVRSAAGVPSAVNPFLKITAQQASRELLGSVERAQGAVLAASDAVVVADAALNVAGGDYSEELDRLFGLSPEHLKQSRSALVSISGELRSARGILGAAPDNLTTDQLHAANVALEQATDLTNRLSDVVKTARTRVDRAKVDVDLWASRGAFGVTAFAVLGTVGQLFMFRFFMRKLLRLPA